MLAVPAEGLLQSYKVYLWPFHAHSLSSRSPSDQGLKFNGIEVLWHLALSSLANAQDKKFKKLSVGEEKNNKNQFLPLSPTSLQQGLAWKFSIQVWEPFTWRESHLSILNIIKYSYRIP